MFGKFKFMCTSLALAGFLVACGGGSGSDNTGNGDGTTPSESNTVEKCASEKSTVYVTKTGCNYSSSNINGGDELTYICKDDMIFVNGSTFSSGMILNDTAFTCGKTPIDVDKRIEEANKRIEEANKKIEEIKKEMENSF